MLFGTFFVSRAIFPMLKSNEYFINGNCKFSRHNSYTELVAGKQKARMKKMNLKEILNLEYFAFGYFNGQKSWIFEVKHYQLKAI